MCVSDECVCVCVTSMCVYILHITSQCNIMDVLVLILGGE